MKYRAEIDGLRALAVVPVILFHAGFELFSGGYVGVDVFFVISGYLITTILIEDIENKHFSLLDFYERRARRILPALFFVMLVCIPFAWMWMLPSQLEDFSRSLVAVSLFASNILFWRESEYFAPAAEEKPLLHTWSLAVEEQYYVLFPVFLTLFWRFGKNRVFLMIILLAAVSLLLSEWGWRNKASANFYLAPTRAWELFAGSIVAFTIQKRGVQKSNLLALIGLGLIIFSVFVYDKYIPFPSMYTLVPVLGVVLLLLYADNDTLAARLLGTRAMVGVGLVSYSAYLWHQPLFAFAKIRSPIYPSSNIMLILFIASLALAYLSWRFVEQPFRKNLSRSFIFFTSSICLCSFFLIGLLGQNSNFSSQRLPAKINEILNAANNENPKRKDCRIDTMQEITHFNPVCWYGDPVAANTKILYWGDSHTDTAAFELYNAMPFAAVYHAAYASCPPILGLKRIDANSECSKFNELILDLLNRENFDYIILSARWRMYITALRFDNGAGAIEDWRVKYDTVADTGQQERQLRVVSAIDSFIRKILKDFPKVRLVVVGQIPEAGWNVPNYIAKRFMYEGSLPHVVLERKTIEVANTASMTLFNSIRAENYIYFEPLNVFCDEHWCKQNDGDNLIYKDDDHLTIYGARKLVNAITDKLMEN